MQWLEDTKFNIDVIYDSVKSREKNTFEVAIGNQSLKANIIPEVGFKKIIWEL